MATIVEYDSRKEPLNAYPERIVSPFQPDSCCADHMMQVGKVEEERGFLYYYRRCRVCGFTIRYFLPVLPPEQHPQIQRQGSAHPQVKEVA
ncbi:MAG: hypothetical protein U9R33_04640 [candidate division NC10 bacterium]|nr:hypothetical protein [candidate division NC10 bacterium]